MFHCSIKKKKPKKLLTKKTPHLIKTKTLIVKLSSSRHANLINSLDSLLLSVPINHYSL